jgi:hypothetical protein
MVSYGMLRSVALVRTDVSEELRVSFIRVTRIGEVGTTLAVTSNRRKLRRNTKWYFFAACVRACVPPSPVMGIASLFYVYMMFILQGSTPMASMTCCGDDFTP